LHFCVLQSPGPSGKVLTRHPGLINPVLPHICIPDRLDSLAQRIHIWIIDLEKGETMGGFYMAYLESLCRRRGWQDPMYETYRSTSGFTCLVLVNGREYQTDLAYESDGLAQENAAMRAFMVCRNFSVNGGMLARNGVVQGLPANENSGRHRRRGGGGRSHSVNLSSSSSTTSSE